MNKIKLTTIANLNYIFLNPHRMIISAHQLDYIFIQFCRNFTRGCWKVLVPAHFPKSEQMTSFFPSWSGLQKLSAHSWEDYDSHLRGFRSLPGDWGVPKRRNVKGTGLFWDSGPTYGFPLLKLSLVPHSVRTFLFTLSQFCFVMGASFCDHDFLKKNKI